MAINVATWSSAASAALDWCHVTTLFPSSTSSFDQSASAIDKFGCTAVPSESAHLRMWKCADAKPDDTFIFLERQVSGYPQRTVLTLQTDKKNLDNLRNCPGIDALPKTFDSMSIALTDQVQRRGGQYGLYRSKISLFVLAGSSYIAGGTPDGEVATYIEEDFFGYRRPSYASSPVELGGKRLFGTPINEVVQALTARGAQVRTDKIAGDGLFRAVELSAPVGLEGVSEIRIQTIKDHVWKVIYTVPTLAAYDALVGALDQKYGRSERSTSSNKGCTYREWGTGYSAAVEIVGEYCASGSHIWFTNKIADVQREAYIKHLDRMSQEPKAPKPQIDKDNI